MVSEDKIILMKNGKLEINSIGSKYWYLNGLRHRLDGPAIIYPDGYKSWWVNGKRHRLDGPAVIHAGGYKRWWVNDIYYTEYQFNNMILTRWIRLFK